MASQGYYTGAINALREAETKPKIFIWLGGDYMGTIERYFSELEQYLNCDPEDDDLPEAVFKLVEEGDPDRFNYAGDIISYSTLESKKYQFIVIRDDGEFDDDEQAEIEAGLTKFYGQKTQESFEEFEEQSWDSFNSYIGKLAIAFRGGYGYTYNLWRMK